MQRQVREDPKKGRQPLCSDRPQQPADVEPCRAQHGMQRVATAAAEPYAFRERHPCVVEDDVLRECYAATASSGAPCGSTAMPVAEARQL